MFTNWLTSPPTSNLGSLPTNVISTAPDIILEVGPSPGTRFMAHSMLLAMHSGYLRSAIRLDENGIHNSELLIFLTNVTPEQFALLLSYMYTGFLDLNIENIFGVLLATHVLHMPRALEICRTQSDGYLGNAFLSQMGDSDKGVKTSGVKVIRPIASKPAVSNLGFVVPPMPHVSLPSTGTPFRSLNNYSNLPITQSKSEENRDNISSSISNGISPKISQLPKDTGNRKLSTKLKKSSSSEKMKQTPSDSATNSQRKETDNENKIIIDVASCDGPVRFRRVLNDAFGRQLQLSEGVHLPHKERSHQSVSNSFHQQMAKNITLRQQSEEVENSEEQKQHQTQNQHLNAIGEVYNCVYCKHTFKSQYCYQKHAKRHLNPLSLEANDSLLSGGSDNDKDDHTSSRSLDGKREVRPLDMNVQYYPCKTCGSKFPSYYFVHKHRKLCHANEESGQ